MNDSDEDLIETVTILYDDDVGNITEYDVPKDDCQSSIQDTDGSLIGTIHKESANSIANESSQGIIEETVAVEVNDCCDKGICLINYHLATHTLKIHDSIKLEFSF